MPQYAPEYGTSEEQAFFREVEEMRKSLWRVNHARAAEIRTDLLELKNELNEALMRAGERSITGKMTPQELRDLLEATEQAITRLDGRLQQGMGYHTSRMARLGGAGIPNAVRGAAMNIALPGLDLYQIEFAKQYSASLIRKISQEALNDINGVMYRATLSGLSPYQAQQELAKILRTQPSRTAPVGKLMRDAERIFRTEGMRVANIANYTRMQQLDQATQGVGGGMMKRWLHGGGGNTPRPYHQDVLHGMVIPMNQDFEIKDYKGQTWHAFGPHDPALPPHEVINCTCTVVPVFPGFVTYDTATKAPERRALARSRIQAQWLAQHRDVIARVADDLLRV